MRRRTLIDELMAEVILYGGLPVRRADAYEDALMRTGSHKLADAYAFGPRAKAIDAEPLTVEQLAALD